MHMYRSTTAEILAILRSSLRNTKCVESSCHRTMSCVPRDVLDLPYFWKLSDSCRMEEGWSGVERFPAYQEKSDHHVLRT